MKLTPDERDVLYKAIREPLLLMRTKIDLQLYELQKNIWSKICADLPDCFVGETGPASQPNKED